MNIDRRTFIKNTAFGAAAFSLLNCRCLYASSAEKPNILYILTDQWRASAMGYAGDPNVKTPNLDKFAGESLNFQNAVSVCPVCTPYRASLLTGKYPTTTGMFMNDLYLPEDELCMAEIFKNAGYDTGYIGKWHLDGHGRDKYIPRQRRQGFDYWKVLECTHDYNNSYYYAGDDPTKRKWEGYDAYAQTKDAQQWFKSRKEDEKPFLFVISYGGPHFPHRTAPEDMKALYPLDSIELQPNVPDELKQNAYLDDEMKIDLREEAQGYYAHCTALDKCVGDLLETLKQTGLDKNTILVFTSDHGEAMGSQGQRVCEKQVPWDESVNVPFLMRHPNFEKAKPRTVKTPINTPDILPTLLGLADIQVPDGVEGSNLSGLILSDQSENDRDALIMSVCPFAGYREGKEYRGIRTSRYTYVRDLDGPWLLYDNQNDPLQMNNLVEDKSSAQLLSTMEKKLQDKLCEIGDPFKPRDYYLKKWGYEIESKYGCIPYKGDHPVQSPKPI